MNNYVETAMTVTDEASHADYPMRWPVHHGGEETAVVTTETGIEMKGLTVPWPQVAYMACTGRFAATVGLRNGQVWRLGFRDGDTRASFAADCANRGGVSAEVPATRVATRPPSRRESALDELLATRVHIPAAALTSDHVASAVTAGWRPAPPSVLATVLVSFFFGIFGIIPASMHARQAARFGYPGTKYWVALVFAWLASVAMWTLFIAVLASG